MLTQIPHHSASILRQYKLMKMRVRQATKKAARKNNLRRNTFPTSYLKLKTNQYVLPMEQELIPEY